MAGACGVQVLVLWVGVFVCLFVCGCLLVCLFCELFSSLSMGLGYFSRLVGAALAA